MPCNKKKKKIDGVKKRGLEDYSLRMKESMEDYYKALQKSGLVTEALEKDENFKIWYNTERKGKRIKYNPIIAKDHKKALKEAREEYGPNVKVKYVFSYMSGDKHWIVLPKKSSR